MKILSKKYLFAAAWAILFCSNNLLTIAADTNPTSCSKIKYVPRTPITVAGSVEITSVKKFSPANLQQGWVTYDHIGYKDSAYQGERHVAIVDDGVQFFGYDMEPLADLMLLRHPDGENQVINTVQVPVRADWHTLNGNGILFGCEFSETGKDIDININGVSSTASITGYSVVATINKIEVRQFSNVNADTIGKEGHYQVLHEIPKKCPGQNLTVEITNSIAKVFLGSEKIYEFTLTTPARGTGLVASYEEHCCSSLSSVVMFNHTVNGIDYLKPKTKEVRK